MTLLFVSEGRKGGRKEGRDAEVGSEVRRAAID
jgi:hypothetical protein